MLFAEMSYLTDERCFRAARGITPFTQTLPHIATWVTGLRGSHRSPPKRWGLAWPCICACPASPSRGEVSEFRKWVVAALFQLCLGGERWGKAISEPWLCHHFHWLPISAKNKVPRPLLVQMKAIAKLKTDIQKDQRGPWLLLVSVVKAYIHVPSRGGHALVVFVTWLLQGCSHNIFRLEAGNKRTWKEPGIFLFCFVFFLNNTWNGFRFQPYPV